MPIQIDKGIRIASAIGDEYGVTTGKTRACRTLECSGTRYQVEWPDGEKTWVCDVDLVTSNRYGLMIGHGDLEDPCFEEEYPRVGPSEPLTEEEKFLGIRDYLLICAQEAFEEEGWKLCLEPDRESPGSVDVSAAAHDSMTSLIVEIASSVAADPSISGKEATMLMARQMILAGNLLIHAALEMSPDTQIEIHVKDSQIVRHGHKPFSQWEPANGKEQEQA